MIAVPSNLPTFEPGWVWLAGAGPGDPGLLTAHALNGIAQADVIVHDALVSGEVMALASMATERVLAGKRGGKPSPTQRDISERLIALAREGRRVLRLKGGDPFMFGRGAEEALALVAASVPFRVIPGISSAIGGLAYAGIPLTHRATNAAVTFLTAHAVGGDVPDSLDWPSLGGGKTPLIIFMPLRQLEAVAKRLMAHGRAGAEPVALVANATTKKQRVLITRLDACWVDMQTHGIAPPALCVVGDIVRLRPGLDWLGALDGLVLDADPLKGA